MPDPLCFVLMPFGKKPAMSGALIDFDAVYEDFVRPSIVEAGLEPLRADEEKTGGIIHKAMFERLILCQYAVCDLTTANPNVFYELGLRHAIRPQSTVLLFAEGAGQLPFDVAPLRALPYSIGADGRPIAGISARSPLINRLCESRRALPDSPVYQIVDGFPDIQRLKTDVFRERVEYSESMKQRLASARKLGRKAVAKIESELGKIDDAETAVVIDLFLSYRAIKSWKDMINLVPKMSQPLKASVMVQEQLGLALNRAGRGDEAEQVLTELIRSRGPSSETYGILGRVYKDRWESAMQSGNHVIAKGLLANAIETYLKGFESDWRDAYPGVNAVTLMEIKEPPDPRRIDLIPVVTYAVKRRIAATKPDYWDYATLLELSFLAKKWEKAREALANALANVRETWETETTARNLRLIREARERRGEDVSRELQIENECRPIVLHARKKH
jgi:tetratricopeptide (TPR) repeat protein